MRVGSCIPIISNSRLISVLSIAFPGNKISRTYDISILEVDCPDDYPIEVIIHSLQYLQFSLVVTDLGIEC